MILLHDSGTIVDTGEISFVQPKGVPSGTMCRVVEIHFRSGEKGTFKDSWYHKGGVVSLYDVMLPDKIGIDWREVLKKGGV